MRLPLDNAEAARYEPACDFTRAVPCPSPASGSTGLARSVAVRVG